MNPNKFLTAEWRKLIMANYAIDTGLLSSYIPPGTEVDIWNDKCYISLVGFMFLNTKVYGIKVPFHINFPEVNLRFYVRRNIEKENKRGVVFIREIVPKRALAFVANTFFNERYVTLPMKYHWGIDENESHTRYEWKAAKWNRLEVKAGLQSQPIKKDSAEEFITEHYWGYTTLKKNRTGAYYVAHPKWEVYPVSSYMLDCDFGNLYGNRFEMLTNQEPESVFLAEGSEVIVFNKTII
jgi:uncharacterized protein YqjF (DUF2071 family)